MQYKQKLEILIAELKSNPKIDLISAKISPGLDEKSLQSLLDEKINKHKLTLPDGFVELYKEMNGFQISWKPKKEVFIDSEEEKEYWNLDVCFCEFLPLQQVLINSAEEMYWGDDEKELKFAFQFLIDYETEMQGTWLLATEKKLEMYYIDNQGEDVRKLKYDFNHFFDLLIASRCFFCWQETILPKVESLQDFVSEEFSKWMPFLFKDFQNDLFNRPHK